MTEQLRRPRMSRSICPQRAGPAVISANGPEVVPGHFYSTKPAAAPLVGGVGDRSCCSLCRVTGDRKTFISVLAKAASGIRFNEHMEGDGEDRFRHACKLGLEGIVSKRKNSPYRSGRSPDWLKMKNVHAPAVKREEEEEWGKKKWR